MGRVPEGVWGVKAGYRARTCGTVTGGAGRGGGRKREKLKASRAASPRRNDGVTGNENPGCLSSSSSEIEYEDDDDDPSRQSEVIGEKDLTPLAVPCIREHDRPRVFEPFAGKVFYYSDFCLLYSDFSLAKHPRGVLQEPPAA